jgi:hypothetical protein
MEHKVVEEYRWTSLIASSISEECPYYLPYCIPYKSIVPLEMTCGLPTWMWIGKKTKKVKLTQVSLPLAPLSLYKVTSILGWLHTRGYWIGGLSRFAWIARSTRIQWMFWSSTWSTIDSGSKAWIYRSPSSTELPSMDCTWFFPHWCAQVVHV